MLDFDPIDDHIALCEAKARYCRLLDTKDWDGFTALFTEDYELDVTEGTGLAVIHGRDAAIAMVRQSIGAAKTAHQVHSPEIVIDGDQATAVWALQDRVIWTDDRPSMTGYGYYRERWVRHEGGWKIAALKLTRLFLDMHPPVRATLGDVQ